MLARFVKNPKKCKDILKQNDKLLKSNKDDLFGSDFYTALNKRAKGSKRLCEARHEFQGPPQKRRRGSSFQPFQHRPFHAGQGGGRQQQFASQGRGRGQSSGRPAPRPGRNSDGQAGRGGRSRYVSKCFLMPRFRHRFRSNRHIGKVWSNQYHRSHTGWGEVSPLYVKLATNNSRSVSVANSVRDDHRVVAEATGIIDDKTTKFRAKGDRTDHKGSRKVAKKRSNRRNCRDSKSVCGAFIPKAQEGRVKTTHFQPESAQQISKIRALQNGGNSISGRSVESQRLHGKTRHQGCLFRHSHKPERQDFLEVPMAKPVVPISSSPIWPRISAKNIHKVAKTSNGTVEKVRDKVCDLPGRSPSHEPGSTGSEKPIETHNCIVRKPGISNQLGKVSDGRSPETGISGFSDRLSQYEVVHAQRKNERSTTAVPKTVKIRVDNSSETSKNHRKDDGSNKSHSAGAIAVQALTTVEDKSIASQQSELRVIDKVGPTVQDRTDVVGRINRTVEWKINDKAKSRSGSKNNHRCITERLGCTLWQDTDTRPVDRRGKEVAYKCPGDASSEFCCESFHEGQIQCASSHLGGQYHHSRVHKQNGGHSFGRSDQDHETIVGILSVQTDHDYCRTPPWLNKPDSRCTVSRLSGQQQLETVTTGLHANTGINGENGNRPICGSNEQTVDEICELEARSRSLGDRCIQNSMEPNEGIRFSSILSHRSMPVESGSGRSNSGVDSSNMANTAMVLGIAGNDHRRSNSVTTSAGSVNITPESNTPTTKSGAHTGSMESVRDDSATESLSEKARTLIGKARRESSKRTYEGPWRKWCSWCDKELLDLVQAPVERIVDFLAEFFDTAPLEYSTLNVYRSALSAYHPMIDGYKVGQHPLVRDLLRGAFNTRPPRPKYAETWDVDSVLRGLIEWGPNGISWLRDLFLFLYFKMAVIS